MLNQLSTNPYCYYSKDAFVMLFMQLRGLCWDKPGECLKS